jgi:anti-anti-sigma regulatory factor
MVLRITHVEPRAHGVTLKLEGRLVDLWAALLEAECTAAFASSGSVTLDLSGVTVIDRAGIGALSRLDRAGVAIRGCSDLIASILSAEGIHADGSAN